MQVLTASVSISAADYLVVRDAINNKTLLSIYLGRVVSKNITTSGAISTDSPYWYICGENFYPLRQVDGDALSDYLQP